MFQSTCVRAQAALILVIAVGFAHAQPAHVPQQTIPWHVDSGPLRAPPHAEGYSVIFSTRVDVPAAPWIRLHFSTVELSGVIAAGNASYLRITSLREPDFVQFLSAESARQWANTSAQMIGDQVLVELLGVPGSGDSRIAIESVSAGLADPTDIYCDNVDNRVLATDPRVARTTVGSLRCSAFLFDDTNRMFLSAGHCCLNPSTTCNPDPNSVAHFNVPLSTFLGQSRPAHPDDQYPIDIDSVQQQPGSFAAGNDWMYLAYHRNSNTGLTAAQAQQQHFALAPTGATLSVGDSVRVTGFGITHSPTPLSWYLAQKTHVGPFVAYSGQTLRFKVDASPGNSGGPAFEEISNDVFAIMTHGGPCDQTGYNVGQNIFDPNLQAALDAPLSLCASGRGRLRPPVYAAGDLANNFGTVDRNTGEFGRIADAPPWMQGLAFNPTAQHFYGVNFNMFAHLQGLYTITPTGAVTHVGQVTGTVNAITGLGYDIIRDVLFGISQGDGQLYIIDTSTAAATPVGPALLGSISSLEYHLPTRMLYAIDNGTPGSVPQVLAIDPVRHRAVPVGPVAPGITAEFYGLAATEAGELFSIRRTTSGEGELWQINPHTGTGVLVGPTGGLFPQALGMSATIRQPIRVQAGQSIQAAINVAGPRDLIIVEPGVYNETIVFQGRPVTVVSSGGPTATFIRNTLLPGSTVTFNQNETPNTILEGFTIEGGLGTTFTMPSGVIRQVGGGLFISSSQPTIRDCIVTGGVVAHHGGGAFLHDSHASIERTTFSENEADLAGGGVAVFGGGPHFVSCTIEDNISSEGGGLYADGSIAIVESSRIQRNLATTGAAGAGAGGLHASGPAVVIVNNWICQNHDLQISGAVNQTGPNVIRDFCHECYANCDESTTPPILTIADFLCFIDEFSIASTLPHHQQIVSYANCDRSSSAPVLTIADFLCFIDEFSLGCP